MSTSDRWNPCPIHASQNQPCRECAFELSPGQVEISEEAERALGGPKVIEAMNVIATRPKDWSEPARSILFRRERRMRG